MAMTVQRRRLNILRSVYPRRSIASRTHIVKRLGQDIVYSVQPASGAQPGYPTLAYTGNGSAQIGSIGAGSLAGTASFGSSLQFKLESVIDPTDLSQLFDRYKIVGVKLKCLFMQNTSDTAGGSMLPLLHYAQDYDDSSVPTSELAVMSKAYCKTKVLNANRPFSIYLKPRVTKTLDTVTGGSITAIGLSSERSPFIDCSYQAVPHYGLKMWCDFWNVINVQNVPEPKLAFKIQPVYYLALKDTQ